WRRRNDSWSLNRNNCVCRSGNVGRSLHTTLDDHARTCDPCGCPFCPSGTVRFIPRLAGAQRVLIVNCSALKTYKLAKRFGANVVTDNLDLDIIEGEVHAIIGPNGAGKTTLINQLIGEIKPNAGRIEFFGSDITVLPVYQRALLGLSRSYQITSVLPNFSAIENVAISAQAHGGHSFGCWRPA